MWMLLFKNSDNLKTLFNRGSPRIRSKFKPNKPGRARATPAANGFDYSVPTALFSFLFRYVIFGLMNEIQLKRLISQTKTLINNNNNNNNNLWCKCTLTLIGAFKRCVLEASSSSSSTSTAVLTTSSAFSVLADKLASLKSNSNTSASVKASGNPRTYTNNSKSNKVFLHYIPRDPRLRIANYNATRFNKQSSASVSASELKITQDLNSYGELIGGSSILLISETNDFDNHQKKDRSIIKSAKTENISLHTEGTFLKGILQRSPEWLCNLVKFSIAI